MAVATPVLLIIFNRPDTTARVWEAIRAAQPAVLLIAADAARHLGEESQVQAARAITEQVDWPCTVHRRYASTNQGCKWGVYNAISWGFELTEELIILEDDCLPHLDFFRFCDSMLNRYRNNLNVFHIGGTCLRNTDISESYYFTHHTYIWGWATWKRAWKLYDINMTAWKNIEPDDFLDKLFTNKRAVQYWKAVFNSVCYSNFDTWDYQWLFTTWLHHGCSIVANVNLISNIGFGPTATHTHHPSSIGSQIPTESLGEIIHPKKIVVNTKADYWVLENVFFGPKLPWQQTWKNKLLKKMKSIFKFFATKD